MIPERILFEGVDNTNLVRLLPRFRAAYAEDGVAIFPGFFLNDPLFDALIRDLRSMTDILSRNVGVPVDPTISLDEQLSKLAAADCPLVGKIYDIGTRPNKLLSGMMLKLHPSLVTMTKQVFSDGVPIIATPSLSDTLHVFPPGADSFRFNLPVHQDYPYLLQSPNQITFWISLSKRQADVGGMTVWCGSHKLGIRPQRRDVNAHLECVTDEIDLSRYEEVPLEADLGDLVVFHSNILHRSEKNYSTDKTRIVQLFRFSDLNDPEALKIGWASADVTKNAKKFEDLYPEMILPQLSQAVG